MTGASGQSSDKALDLDGNDYASRSALPAMNGTTVTVSAWIKTSNSLTANQYYAVMAQSTYDDPDYLGFWLGLNDDNHEPSFALGNSIVIASGAVAVDQWSHIAGTYDGTSLRIYVNGSISGSPGSVPGEHGIADNFVVGYANDGTNAFIGAIDDVRVYNYALSENQVEGLYKYAQHPTVFSVQNSSNKSVAWIDSEGNLFLTGDLTRDPNVTGSSGTDEFRIQDANSVDVAVIDMITGDMEFAGILHEQVSNFSGAIHFIIKDSDSNVVAYIDTWGNLYLKGKAYPDSPEL